MTRRRRSAGACLRVVGAFLAAISIAQGALIDFSLVPKSFFPASGGEVFSGAWGDYDGDVCPDLFPCGLTDGPGELLRNTAAGFVRVAGGALDTDSVPRAGVVIDPAFYVVQPVTSP